MPEKSVNANAVEELIASMVANMAKNIPDTVLSKEETADLEAARRAMDFAMQQHRMRVGESRAYESGEVICVTSCSPDF